MNRFIVSCIGIVSLAWVTPVLAQPQVPLVNRSPTFSPYLNLLRGGINPAINYYGMVRPQLAFQQQAFQLQQQVNQNAQSLQTLQTFSTAGLQAQQPQLPYSGHPVVFNSLGGYFNNLPVGRGGGGGAMGGGSPAFMNPIGFGVPGGFSPMGTPVNSTPAAPFGGATPGFAPPRQPVGGSSSRNPKPATDGVRPAAK
ncbi:MAG: hypothetical protein LC104_20970 [Bacteroidales bacterium]|nr:hypothetical protein [Bacteroidales bacterium]